MLQLKLMGSIGSGGRESREGQANLSLALGLAGFEGSGDPAAVRRDELRGSGCVEDEASAAVRSDAGGQD